MNEFLFGSLATLEQRVAYAREQTRGVRHLHRLRPPVPRPGQSPTITVSVALPQPVARVVCTILEPERAVVELQPGEVTWDLLNWNYGRNWQGTLPAYPAGTVVRYEVHAHLLQADKKIPADGGERFSYLVGEPGPPAWAREAIIYQIFPDRFHPGRGRQWRPVDNLEQVHGGTLRGIIDHLGYVADLGFNCIWLNPFFPDETYHGYHATDYFRVNERLGTMDDVRELVAVAHARGIRLLLDFVANHWGRAHPTFQAALADRNSEYYDWYTWEAWPHYYKAFFGVQALPQVNLDNPAARTHMLEAADFWLGEVGFDGYRLDYALGPSLDFWTDFRASVKAAHPDAWIFGEVVGTPPMQRCYDGRLDGTLDFVLMQALRDTFAFHTMSVAGLDSFLHLHRAFFPDYFLLPSFLDNHDVNRFLWLVQGDRRKLKLAALCQFTLPGPPIVYYGTEVGLSQTRDIVQEEGHKMEEARAPMLWGAAQDDDLHAFYRRLIHFRRQHPTLWQGVRRTVHLNEAAGTWAYTCADEEETILVVFNAGTETRSFTAAGRAVTLAPWEGDLLAL